ncbi:MAG: cytochrome P460 family protein [bacterium]|nr:MAG: cytochrome P460 family protein [bacterium]
MIAKTRLSLIILMTLFLPALAWTYVATGELPLAYGEQVWKYITETDPYSQWELWPGTERLFKGKHPHGSFLTTYVSSGALRAIKNRESVFPNGAMIVKDNFSPDKQLAAVTVMYRIKGYNPDAGDWFWVKFKPDGAVESEGKVQGCINCHMGKIDNDWAFTGPLK